MEESKRYILESWNNSRVEPSNKQVKNEYLYQHCSVSKERTRNS